MEAAVDNTLADLTGLAPALDKRTSGVLIRLAMQVQLLEAG